MLHSEDLALMLVRIVAPHFVAGCILDERGRVVEAAPIIRWMLGKSWPELRPYLARNGWVAARLPLESRA